MSQKTNNNLIGLPFDAPSDEVLAKYAPADREEIKKLAEQAKRSREETIKKLNDQKEQKIIKDQKEYEARLKEVDDGFKKLYSKPIALPAVIQGNNGLSPMSHKNKLAFIFVGDTYKSETEEKNVVNAPKISLVVGGGLESAYSDKIVEIDPRKDNIAGVSSQIHLISMSDVDVKDILPISTLFNRSTIKTKADTLELYANETVIIRSLGEAYGSKGTRTMAPGGVHIVSGTGLKENEKPQPMVLGKNLSDALLRLLEIIGEMNSTMISMNSDMLFLKSSLLAHTHVGAVGPVAPSIDLATLVAPTIATKTALNISNGYSNLLNLELLKTDKLTAFSPGKFLSDFNRVN